MNETHLSCPDMQKVPERHYCPEQRIGDLVSRSSGRSRGYGGLLFDWLPGLAAQLCWWPRCLWTTGEIEWAIFW